VIAPIMPEPLDGWREAYAKLLDDCSAALADLPGSDLTVELITHRFTDASKRVIEGWYPATKLDLDPASRVAKVTKFGGTKYVYPRDVTSELRRFFDAELPRRLPPHRVLYWT